MTLRDVLDGCGKPLIIDAGEDTDDGLAVAR
jgi:hypothetical protein